MKNIVIVGLFLWTLWLSFEINNLQEDVKVLQQLSVGLQEDGQRL